MKKKLGRPKILKSRQQISVSLPSNDIHILKKIGNGNASEAIRILIKLADTDMLIKTLEDNRQ